MPISTSISTDNITKSNKYDELSPMMNDEYNQTCVVYKFQSRPPYEGFILILVIVVIIVLLLWWLNSKLKVDVDV